MRLTRHQHAFSSSIEKEEFTVGENNKNNKRQTTRENANANRERAGMWLLLLSGCNKLGEKKRWGWRKEGREEGRDCLSFIISIVIYHYGHAAALKIYQFIMRYSAFYEEERQKERTTTTSSGGKSYSRQHKQNTKHERQKWKQDKRRETQENSKELTKSASDTKFCLRNVCVARRRRKQEWRQHIT